MIKRITLTLEEEQYKKFFNSRETIEIGSDMKFKSWENYFNFLMENYDN